MATPIEPCSFPSSLSAVPACKRDVGEGAVAVVAVEKIRAGIIGDEEIRPSVAVEIAPDRAHAEPPIRIGDAGLDRHVLERAVAFVVIERVAGTRQSARAALHGDAVELAELAFAELGQRVEPDVDVVGDEQVEPAVAVVVGERRAGRPPRIADAGLRGDVRERPVVIVAIQMVRAVAGDVEVVPAVVVEVGGDRAHAPSGIADTCLVRDVDERAVAADSATARCARSAHHCAVATVGELTR